MRTMPNQSILEGTARRIVAASDGHGAEVAFEVSSAAAAPGHADLIRAAAGTTLTLFAAEPDELAEGRRYRITASLLGGPGGERIVIESAEPDE